MASKKRVKKKASKAKASAKRTKGRRKSAGGRRQSAGRRIAARPAASGGGKRAAASKRSTATKRGSVGSTASPRDPASRSREETASLSGVRAREEPARRRSSPQDVERPSPGGPDSELVGEPGVAPSEDVPPQR